MYEHFTDRARKVMEIANLEAQRYNHEYVGSEHMLLGMIKEGSGVACHVLRHFGMDLQILRTEIERVSSPGPETAILAEHPLVPRVKNIINYAFEESRKLGHRYVGTEHLLLGLLREPDCLGAQVIKCLGTELDDMRQYILDLLGKPKEAQPPEPERLAQAPSLPQPTQFSVQFPANPSALERVLEKSLRRLVALPCNMDIASITITMKAKQ